MTILVMRTIGGGKGTAANRLRTAYLSAHFHKKGIQDHFRNHLVGGFILHGVGQRFHLVPRAPEVTASSTDEDWLSQGWSTRLGFMRLSILRWQPLTSLNPIFSPLFSIRTLFTRVYSAGDNSLLFLNLRSGSG